jgi:hypothetical protein
VQEKTTDEYAPPLNYRIRKRILNTEERGKHAKRIKKAQQA